MADIEEMGDHIAGDTSTVEEALDALNEIASNIEEANWSVQEASDVDLDCRSQKY